MLVARWGVLWRPLKCTLENNAKAGVVFFKLHNFILDNSDDYDVPPPSGHDDGHHGKLATGTIYKTNVISTRSYAEGAVN